MNLVPIDSITAILMFFVYFKSQEEKTRLETLIAQEEMMRKAKEGAVSQNIWNEECEARHQEFLGSWASSFFQSWISPKTFAASLACSVASVALGYTSIPGFILGISFSSPKADKYLIKAYHILVGSNKKTSGA